MIFYQLEHGQLVATQAEAKASGLTWQQVDVPVDKAGLMDYLNALAPVEAPPPPPPPPPPVSYSIKSIEIDEVFENLPLGHQLTLAALALENARTKTKS